MKNENKMENNIINKLLSEEKKDYYDWENM
jgi:hypothetical protein